MNYTDKPTYAATDFSKGQAVYLKVITDSNMARHFGFQAPIRWTWENPPALDEEYISARIVKGTVLSVGRKYLTVKPERGYYTEVKFDMTAQFVQSIDSGSLDFEVFRDRKEAENDICFEYYYQRVHFGLRSPSKYSFREIKRIYDAMFSEKRGLQEPSYLSVLIRMSMILQRVMNRRSDIEERWLFGLPDEQVTKLLSDWAGEFVDQEYPSTKLWEYTVMKVFDAFLASEDDAGITAWYFTFGSDERFPVRNTFIIVYAQSEADAVSLFRRSYPRAHEGIPEYMANCSFVYPEWKWKGSTNQKVFGDMPAEVIFACNEEG